MSRNKFLKLIESTVLCLRFPFLYPRNRFTDRHYTNWDLEDQLKFLKNVETDKIFITTEEYVKKENGKYNTNRTNFFNINGTSYSILPYKTKFVIRKGMEDIETFDIKYTDKCTIKSIEYDITNKKLVFGIEGDKNDFNLFLLIIGKHKIISFLIKLINILYSFISLFHCLPTHTELDAMPSGWRKAFGIKMCKDIRKELLKYGWKTLYHYRIEQIKEKYGTLRWYDNGVPEGSKIYDIISKYENLSYQTCINCGNPAEWISKGWISPYCDNCINDDTSNYTKIEEK